MAETTGTVGFVKVNATANGNFALTEVIDANTTPPTSELFFVWFTAAEQRVPTGPEWLMRAMQVSLLREAINTSKTVTVFHDDTSPFINSLQLNAL